MFAILLFSSNPHISHPSRHCQNCRHRHTSPFVRNGNKKEYYLQKYSYFQERLRSLHRLIYDIDAERTRNEQCIESILRAEKATESPSSNDESSSSSQQVSHSHEIWLVMINMTTFMIWLEVHFMSLDFCLTHFPYRSSKFCPSNQCSYIIIQKATDEHLNELLIAIKFDVI